MTRDSYTTETAGFELVFDKSSHRKFPSPRAGRSVIRTLFFAAGWPLLAAASLPVPAAADPLLNEPIKPVPLEVDLDARKVDLGRRLFSDSRLSGDNGVPCAPCHHYEKGLTDGIPLSRGLPGNAGITNTLGLFNVALNSKYTWSGRLFSLEKHTLGVVEGPRTMGTPWEEVVRLLGNDVEMTSKFKEIYPNGLDRENIIDVIVAFEKSLNTPNAPFDRYLRGDENAISEDTRAGYQLFKDYGCISCHQGVNVGGNMLQVFGICGMAAVTDAGAEVPGAAKDSGISQDRPVFRVPSLRNVEHTAPYFHDGSAATLRDAIGVMAERQLGRNVPEEDVAKIELFLKSLSGEYQGVSVGDL